MQLSRTIGSSTFRRPARQNNRSSEQKLDTSRRYAVLFRIGIDARSALASDAGQDHRRHGRSGYPSRRRFRVGRRRNVLRPGQKINVENGPASENQRLKRRAHLIRAGVGPESSGARFCYRRRATANPVLPSRRRKPPLFHSIQGGNMAHFLNNSGLRIGAHDWTVAGGHIDLRVLSKSAARQNAGSANSPGHRIISACS